MPNEQTPNNNEVTHADPFGWDTSTPSENSSNPSEGNQEIAIGTPDEDHTPTTPNDLPESTLVGLEEYRPNTNANNVLGSSPESNSGSPEDPNEGLEYGERELPSSSEYDKREVNSENQPNPEESEKENQKEQLENSILTNLYNSLYSGPYSYSEDGLKPLYNGISAILSQIEGNNSKIQEGDSYKSEFTETILRAAVDIQSVPTTPEESSQEAKLNIENLSDITEEEKNHVLKGLMKILKEAPAAFENIYSESYTKKENASLIEELKNLMNGGRSNSSNSTS